MYHLWKELVNWLQNIANIKLIVNVENIITGVLPREDNMIPNIVILIIKRYIYVSRCRNAPLSNKGAIEYLKHYILIEKFAFPDKWYKKWGEVGPILSSYQVL